MKHFILALHNSQGLLKQLTTMSESLCAATRRTQLQHIDQVIHQQW